MSDEDLKACAKQLILEHAKDIEFLTIWETFEDLEDDADAERIDEFIRKAKVTVSWDGE